MFRAACSAELSAYISGLAQLETQVAESSAVMVAYRHASQQVTRCPWQASPTLLLAGLEAVGLPVEVEVRDPRALAFSGAAEHARQDGGAGLQAQIRRTEALDEATLSRGPGTTSLSWAPCGGMSRS